jgi:hypothetical protein
LALAEVEQRFSIVRPTILITVLPPGVPGNQEDEFMLGRGHHAALFLTAEATMNVAPTVIELFRYE